MSDPRFIDSLRRVVARYIAEQGSGVESRQQRRAAARAASKRPLDACPIFPCRHPYSTPAFDEDAARSLDAYEVRRRWPRFDGVCPFCRERVIMYASYAHYILGDY